MRKFLGILCVLAGTASAQIPDSGVFRYELFDNGDRKVGTYNFTIQKEARLWRITSDMSVDAHILFLKVKLHDHNSFTHDGESFQSFDMKYFKDVPLQKTIDQTVTAVRDGATWTIQVKKNNETITRTLENKAFDEVRNLISRLIRPEAILRPGAIRSTRSLDPLTLTIDTVESRGLGEESISFQGKVRRLHVMEQKAADGDVRVKKFDNGLIYHSQTDEGYARLISAETRDF